MLPESQLLAAKPNAIVARASLWLLIWGALNIFIGNMSYA